MELVTPARAYLGDYRAALETGWSPRPTRPDAAGEELAAIEEDGSAFLASLDDPMALGGPVRVADGSLVPRLPSFRRWIWADGFCGSIELRWQRGSNDLPATCSGHIGYAVVPWRRRQGLATSALRALLPLARDVGLRRLDITTDPANVASIRVIEKAGGALLSREARHPTSGAGDELRFQIVL